MENNLLGQLNLDQVVFWEPEEGRVFEGECYALDTETEKVDKKQPQIIPRMVIAAVYDGKKAYFLTPRIIAAFLRIHADLIVIMHNAAFDLAVIHQEITLRDAEDFDVYTLVEPGKVRDTQILHRLYDLAIKGSGEWKGSSLEKSCREHLEIEVEKDIKDESGQSVRENFGLWLDRPADLPAVYLEYLLGDIVVTYQLFQKFKLLYKQLGVDIIQARPFGFIDKARLCEAWRLYGPLTHHIQLKSAIVLSAVTRNGIRFDTSRLAAFRQELLKEQQDISEKLLAYGYRPGKGSIESLQRILLQVESNNDNIRFTRKPTGRISTKAEHLEPYKVSVPFIDLYVRFQKTKYLLGTFLDKMQKGVLHPEFDILKSTGRTSAFGDISSQNLPRDERVRDKCAPFPGHVFVRADYSSIEMVTLGQATLSQFGGKSAMADAINSGADLHRFTASRLTGKPEAEITDEERRKAKAVNFGFPGGMGARRFREHAKATYGIDMTEAEAEESKKIWFDTFPEMRRFLEENSSPGEGIARLLGINCDDYSHATGKYMSPGPDKIGMLGGMAKKVFSDPAPRTGTGRLYTEAERNYFWSRLDTIADRLSKKHCDSVRHRVPSPDIAAAISDLACQKDVLTLSGRLRANATFCALRNTIFQGLAADGAKLAMWKLMRAGFRIANYIHDEFLIEIPEQSDYTESVETIKRLMIEGMREVVPDVRIDVKVK
ncbi:MAG: DNA polymerase [Planctomycetaceae bacterium]|nr:DNA polymerase [Planctomycetaceae bacterium]MCL2305642.1 DNA polymerase [Planctomycetaceae bacterium]